MTKYATQEDIWALLGDSNIMNQGGGSGSSGGTMLSTLAADRANFVMEENDLTDIFNSGELYDRISSGDFEGLHVGDYFTADTKTITATTSSVIVNETKKPITYRLAHFDYYRNYISDLGHHCVVVPDDNIGTSCMYKTSTNANGYVGSYYYTDVSPKVDDILTEVFNDHLLPFSEVVTLDNTGKCTFVHDLKHIIMDEWEVFGVIQYTTNPLLDRGFVGEMLSLFRSTNYRKASANWWLRSLCGAPGFCYVTPSGGVSSNRASYTYGVRPRFLIG